MIEIIVIVVWMVDTTTHNLYSQNSMVFERKLHDQETQNWKLLSHFRRFNDHISYIYVFI